jgi:type I restriction enzyme S subunit
MNEMSEDSINEPYKLPDGWRWVRLGEVCEISQYGLTATATDVPSGIPYIRITDIDDFGDLKVNGLKFIEFDENTYAKYALKEGDILFARSGSIGRTFLYKGTPPKAVFA